ncbi:MAG: hypothetical protein A2X84_10505 [Desulfuromonadaceae bacterium GWC2_58_13]|nr:MAG: hypothetical protein A2X84_10505 [Desulfuromonadaceae bacterium GWC2_58_13]
MKRLTRSLLWTILFLLILVAIDQFFMRVPAHQPALNAVRHFYLDFRTRLPHLVPGQKTTSVEAVIERAERAPARRQPQPESKKPAPATAVKDPSYFYADDQGELRFADSLDEIPKRFRKEAQRLEQ